jgi:hypothetical protein
MLYEQENNVMTWIRMILNQISVFTLMDGLWYHVS